MFFRTPQKQWGFNNPAIFNILTKARDETTLAKRIALYKQANNMIMNFLPGVPYVHTSPALAFQKNVKGYVPSPVDIQFFSSGVDRLARPPLSGPASPAPQSVHPAGPKERLDSLDAPVRRSPTAAARPDPARALDPRLRLDQSAPGQPGAGAAR